MIRIECKSRGRIVDILRINIRYGEQPAGYRMKMILGTIDLDFIRRNRSGFLV